MGTESNNSKERVWNSIAWMFPFLKPYTLWLVIGVISTLVVAFLELWLGNLIDKLTNYAEQKDSAQIYLTAMWILVLVPLGLLGKYFMDFGSARSIAFAMRDIRNYFVNHIGKLPVSYLEKQHSGDLVSKLTNDLHIIDEFFKVDFLKWFYQPIIFIGAFIYLLTINWKLVVFSLLLLPVGILVAQIVSKPFEKLADEAQEHIGRTNAVLQDTISGMPLVKTYQLKESLFQSYRSFLTLEVQKKLKMEKRELLGFPIIFFMMYSPILFCIIYGSYLITEGQLDTSGLITFIYLIFLVIEPVTEIPQMITQLYAIKGASRRVSELLHQPTEEQATHNEMLDKIPLEHMIIQFNHVRFAYHESGTTVLHDLNEQIAEGNMIALVGSSGGGKSTVFKLLCGFYPLESEDGDILFYGKSIQEWNLSQLRSQISLVTQETYLFSGTIYDNIAYGKLGATLEEVIEAAKSANAHSFISELSQAYQTEVGERGVGLSIGQRQRIAIARALLKDAPILLLDEPTSALDAESEYLVQEALSNLMQSRTTMVIAHRLSTIQNADQIWVLDNGRIIEKGNHHALLERNGTYAKLYYKQFENELVMQKESVS